jgi:multicomponent Na+:H+ antiporter subunit G
MSGALEIAGGALLALGALACLVGALGILRMPDFYTRIHAASLSDTVGGGLVLLGLMGFAGAWLVAGKLAIIGILLFFTGPVATHALAKAAHGRGVQPLLAEGDPPSKP